MEEVPPKTACACSGDWAEIEARFLRAKDALLSAQAQHSDAAAEHLAVRAGARCLLEALFPEPPSCG